MHFEILVEGQTELTVLSTLMRKILGEYKNPHTWNIHKHRGIGRLPEELSAITNRNDQTLLHNLPSKLRAYGDSMKDDEAVVVLVDLDDREDCKEFKKELEKTLKVCPKKPTTLFRIAIEELEAWFLGDQPAILKAFPEARTEVINAYKQDSQCGTWEVLANAIEPETLKELQKQGRRSWRILDRKKKWAVKISRHMDVEGNQSPSFRAFRDGIRKIADHK
jgi:DNA-binding Lrp family transcriptional regulator